MASVPTAALSLLNFASHKPLQSFAVGNDHPGAVELANRLADFLRSRKDLTKLVAALEFTPFYGIHVANYLSSCEVPAPFHTAVYCLNPKAIKNYKKSFIDLGKNDYVDAFVIADFACANRKNEVKIHQHKCALALTARKFVRPIFGLLVNHQFYFSDRVVQA